MARQRRWRVQCVNVCVGARGGLRLEKQSLILRTLIVILVLIEWLQTKPCRPHWLPKPGIMVSLWGGKVIQGLEAYQTLSNGLWEGVALDSVLKLVAELKQSCPQRFLSDAKLRCCWEFLTRASEWESIWHHLNYLYTQLYLMMIKATHTHRYAHRHTHLPRHCQSPAAVVVETLKVMIIRW